MDFQGLKLRVIEVEGLLLLKLIAFRPQDQLDVRGLLAANVGQVERKVENLLSDKINCFTGSV